MHGGDAIRFRFEVIFKHIINLVKDNITNKLITILIKAELETIG